MCVLIIYFYVVGKSRDRTDSRSESDESSDEPPFTYFESGKGIRTAHQDQFKCEVLLLVQASKHARKNGQDDIVWAGCDDGSLRLWNARVNSQ